MPDRPPVEVRQRVEKVKAYLNAMQNSKHPISEAVQENELCRLARGKSVSPADRSVSFVCGLTSSTK